MKMSLHLHLCLLAGLGLLGQSNCSDSNSSNSSRAAPPAKVGYGGVIAGTLAIADGAPPASIANANITVQNHPEIVGTTGADGSFVLENILPGTLNVFVSSSDGVGLADKPAEYAKLFKDVVVRNEETNQLGSHEFKKSGALTGKVTFFDNANNLDLTGSDVYIPGTSFIAKTDDKGAFILAGLPEGTLTLKAQHTGYAILSLDVEVKSGETIDLGELPLSLSNGPEGGLSVQADSTPTIAGRAEKLSLSRTVTLNISYDKNSSLMKISDEPSFLNRNWIPVAPSTSWNFSSDGPKKIYVMFSDLNGLESSPYSDTVIIDTEVPTLAAIQILNGWEQTAKSTVYIDVTTADSGSGISEVIFSNSLGTFNNTQAQPYSARLDWSLSSSDGAKIVYAKVRDYAGRESTVVQDNINLATSGRTIVYATTYTDDITLKKAQSPFWIKSGSDPFIFKGSFIVEPGAVIYFDNTIPVKFNGPVNIAGTAADPIIVRSVNLVTGNCMMASGAELNFNGAPPGVTTNNVIRYTEFKSIGFMRFNGGLVENNSFDNSGCTSYSMGRSQKSGLDNLMVRNNTFNTWAVGLDVTEGNGNTSFINNTGTFEIAVNQSGTAANTTVTGNQFTSTSSSSNSSALLTWSNDNDIIGYASNTFSGSGTSLSVNSARTTDLTLTGLTISGCGRPLIASNNRTTSLTNSTINCEYGDDSSSFNTATIIYSQNTINVSKALVVGGYSTPATVQFTANKVNIECGATAGTYCDVFYAKGRECGISSSGNNGSSCSSPSCTVYNGVNATISGNNIYCKGNASSGCRGLTLHLAPDQLNTEADESVNCDFNYSSALQLSLNGNYWESSAGYKSIANGANLQSSAVTDNGFTSSTSDTVSGLSSTAITAYFLAPIAGQTLVYSGWPTSISTSSFHASAPP